MGLTADLIPQVAGESRQIFHMHVIVQERKVFIGSFMNNIKT